MTTLDNEKVAKSCIHFYCEKCQYKTNRKSSIYKHYSTAKHLKTTENNGKVAKSCKTSYSCNICEKDFKDRAGLWRHKKKCKEIMNEDEDMVYEEIMNKEEDMVHEEMNNEELNNEELSKKEVIQINNDNDNDNNNNNNNNNNEPSDKEMMMLLMKEYSELKNIMMEIVKNGTHNTTNSHNINSHNKTFNLQFFLHETCKDAMNIMEFVDSIKLQLSDLEKVGSVGYVEGISNIITSNLKALDVTQRPIHCTDNKREVLYVKDEDKWEKDNDEKKKIRKAIKQIAHKNTKLIPEFTKKYPDCVKSHSNKSDQYNKLIIEAMGGLGENELEKEDKIIKKITKEVTIDKYMD